MIDISSPIVFVGDYCPTCGETFGCDFSKNQTFMQWQNTKMRIPKRNKLSVNLGRTRRKFNIARINT